MGHSNGEMVLGGSRERVVIHSAALFDPASSYAAFTHKRNLANGADVPSYLVRFEGTAAAAEGDD